MLASSRVVSFDKRAFEQFNPNRKEEDEELKEKKKNISINFLK
jgi:hypothetical protein